MMHHARIARGGLSLLLLPGCPVQPAARPRSEGPGAQSPQLPTTERLRLPAEAVHTLSDSPMPKYPTKPDGGDLAGSRQQELLGGPAEVRSSTSPHTSPVAPTRTVRTLSAQLGEVDPELRSVFGDLQKRHEQRSQPAAGQHESLDYDTVFNAAVRAEEAAIGRRRQWFGYSGATLQRWCLTVMIGVGVGLIAFFLGECIEKMTLWKNRQMNDAVLHHDAVPAFLQFSAINVLLVLCATLPTVLIAPEAASSGIPEVMGYLNGVHIRGIMRLRTLVVKVVGTFFSVSSGLTVGPEGPLVHAGAIVGSVGAGRGPIVALRAVRFRLESACVPHVLVTKLKEGAPVAGDDARSQGVAVPREAVLAVQRAAAAAVPQRHRQEGLHLHGRGRGLRDGVRRAAGRRALRHGGGLLVLERQAGARACPSFLCGNFD